MKPTFDDVAQKAIDLAKQAVPEGSELTAGLLLAALFHATNLKKQLPDLTEFLDEPKAMFRDGGKRPLAKPIRPVIVGLGDGPVGAKELFFALALSEPGREFLNAAGAAEEEIAQIGAARGEPLETAPTTQASTDGSWRASSERQEVITALSTFGRMLTATEIPHRGVVGVDVSLRALEKVLVKEKRRNAVIIGPPGCGKSALVYEFARRLVDGDPSIPPILRDMDVFEMSPSFLRSGASMVGQYDERVKSLLEILRASPKVILFVDEVHSLLQSGMHERTPYTNANEEFKKALGKGEITLIGCTTTAEYRHYIAPDGALDRRLGKVRMKEPSRDATGDILKARLFRLERHYAPLRVPEEMLAKVVELTEEYLPGRYQPDKSIQLIDEACAWCSIHEPPLEEVTEESLMEALQDTIGHSLVKPEQLTEEIVGVQLKAKIVGQDAMMADLAHAFVAGLGKWKKAKGPRGNFFFCGPTGVGKTETAKVLAKILGGGDATLLRVDCNTLQGSGIDSGPALNRLLGPPPGYIGYVRGEGGLLSKIRDNPECVVLFDEIEKADPGVAKTLLQILDEGRTEDADGNLLDFRRAFLVFTTNAGSVYGRRHSQIGFIQDETLEVDADTPSATVAGVQDELRHRGFPEEFLGRHFKWFVFDGLGRDDIRVVIDRQLAELQDTAELRGYKLEWSDDIIDHLTQQWQPRFGVRHLSTILRNRISEQLSVAEAQGELRGVEIIRLELIDMSEREEDVSIAGMATRERVEDTLIIRLV